MEIEYNITYRQKNKGWQFIISYKDEKGRWKQKSKQGFKTKKEAKPEAEKMLKEIKINNKNNTSYDYNLVTFEKVKNNFLEHKEIYVKYSSYQTYERNLKAFNELNNIIFTRCAIYQITNIVI